MDELTEGWHTCTHPQECAICIYRDARPDEYVRITLGPVPRLTDPLD